METKKFAQLFQSAITRRTIKANDICYFLKCQTTSRENKMFYDASLNDKSDHQ